MFVSSSLVVLIVPSNTLILSVSDACSVSYASVSFLNLSSDIFPSTLSSYRWMMMLSKYLFIPHDEVSAASSFNNLKSRFIEE